MASSVLKYTPGVGATWLGATDFGPHERLAVDLSPALTVFVGRNGCGKSVALEAARQAATTVPCESPPFLVPWTLPPNADWVSDAALAQLRKTIPAAAARVIIVRKSDDKCEVGFDMGFGREISFSECAGMGVAYAWNIISRVEFAAEQAPRGNMHALLFFDDVERHLHPLAARSIAEYLAKPRPNVQILASTHHPCLLDAVPHECVRVLRLRDDGTTACQPLTAHPKFEKWKGELRAGEMWTLFGEDWVQ